MQAPRPLQRRTFVRDLMLLGLHLAVYVVVIGGILNQLQFVGYDALSVRYASFDAIFWPAYAWGTLIAAQAGATVFQRRRVLGVVLGAMTSVLLGTWVLGQIVEYEVTAIVFRSIAVALIALALGTSLVRRPPAFMLAEVSVHAPRTASGPVLAPARRTGLASFPGVLFGMCALVFMLTALVGGSYRALEVRGSGESGQRDIAIPAFDRMSVIGTGQVIVRWGDRSSVSISGDANLIEYADVRVDDGELRIGFDPGAFGQFRLERPLVYTVTTPTLTSLDMGGEIDVSLEPSAQPLSSLRVTASDQARFAALDLVADSVSAAIEDEAVLTLDGQVENLVLEAEDDAIVDLGNLAATSASVTARSAAQVFLGPTGELKYQQSGIAEIQCGAGSVILPGSAAEEPQCGTISLWLWPAHAR